MHKYRMIIKLLIFITMLSYPWADASSQVSEYKSQLAKNMASFKFNAFNESERLEIINSTNHLHEQVNFHVNLMDSNDEEYYTLLSLEKKISDFYYYINCFSTNLSQGITRSKFIAINSLLGIYPKKLDVSCDLAELYEVEIGSFKAYFVYNKLIPEHALDFKTINVEYKVYDHGHNVIGGSLGVGANLFRCIRYKSDEITFYPPITSMKCTLIKSNLNSN